MYVVNFFGAPCTGKSTIAACIFHKFKKYLPGFNVELVTEVAKDLCWENNSMALRDQLYVAGKQEHRLYRLSCSDVDIAITDAPLMLQTIYYNLNNKPNSEEFEKVIFGHSNMYQNINFMLYPRSKINYENAGRNYDFERQEEITGKILDLFEKYKIDYINVSDDIDSTKIYRDILKIIEKAESVKDDWT